MILHFFLPCRSTGSKRELGGIHLHTTNEAEASSFTYEIYVYVNIYELISKHEGLRNQPFINKIPSVLHFSERPRAKCGLITLYSAACRQTRTKQGCFFYPMHIHGMGVGVAWVFIFDHVFVCMYVLYVFVCTFVEEQNEKENHDYASKIPQGIITWHTCVICGK